MAAVYILTNEQAGWNNNVELAVSRFIYELDCPVVFYDTCAVSPELPDRTRNGSHVMTLSVTSPVPAREHVTTVLFQHRNQEELRSRIIGLNRAVTIDLKERYPDLFEVDFGAHEKPIKYIF